MFVCNYRKGNWENFFIKPYQEFKISPSSKVFHYGQAVFEGLKAYNGNDNKILLFRPEENQKRLNKSAKMLDMPEVPKEVFMEGLNQLLKIDKEWIPKEEGSSLYIRPFIIANGKTLLATSSEEYIFSIILSPVGNYFGKNKVKLKVEDKYSRVAFGGLGEAKVAGNYAASFFPAKKASLEGFDQVIWTDDISHEYIEEVGAMNIMFRIGDTLVTPSTENGRILKGITRKSIIDLARDMGIKVEERSIKVQEILDEHKKGNLLEVFGLGTAAVVSSVGLISYKGQDLKIDSDSDYGKRLKERMIGIQTGKLEDKFGWRQKV